MTTTKPGRLTQWLKLQDGPLRSIFDLLRERGWHAARPQLIEDIANEKSDDERRAALQFFLGWLDVERGADKDAEQTFQSIERPNFFHLVSLGLAIVHVTRHDHERARQLLDEAEGKADPADRTFAAFVAHYRGTIEFRVANLDGAVSHLLRALRLYGRDSFGYGRVLDTLGMIYFARSKFHAARVCFERALAAKEEYRDDAGKALSHGQLGRLHLALFNLDEAKVHFENDLKLARRTGDKLGVTAMLNALGRVDLLRGDLEAAGGWLDVAIKQAHGKWSRLEGFARKDRALVHLAQNPPELEKAEAELDAAKKLLEKQPEGRAHVARSRAILLRAQKRFDEAEAELEAAVQHWQSLDDQAELAETFLELARTYRANAAPRCFVLDTYRVAVDAAEKSRRDNLVGRIDDELAAYDELEQLRRSFRRVRGRQIREAPISLQTGVREVASIIFYDLKGYTDYARDEDPATVMKVMSQLMAELQLALVPHRVQVNQYLGDGFMALVRGEHHAQRAVSAALDLRNSLDSFNELALILTKFRRPGEREDLPIFQQRIGIATGPVIMGNVGTYLKMDFTAIGITVNRAARLQAKADPGDRSEPDAKGAPACPCIDEETWKLVRTQFKFKVDDGRPEDLKGIGLTRVWDVVERLEKKQP